MVSYALSRTSQQIGKITITELAHRAECWTRCGEAGQTPGVPQRPILLELANMSQYLEVDSGFI
jgi:hypothetical protein